MPNVATANPARKVPVLPRMINVIAGVTRTGIVSNPLAVVVNVRSLRVPGRVGIMTFLRSGRGMSFTT